MMIQDMRVAMLVCALAVVATIAIQPWLISIGYPNAVWLWCDMFKFCRS